VSAASLSWRSTLALCGLALAVIVLLSLEHEPLPWPDGDFQPAALFILALAMALALSVVFIAAYIFRVADEARQMSDALAATQMALDREQRISAVGSLAAAAAHELGSPLGTIAVVAKEIARDLPSDSPLRSDVDLLLSESARCRDILARLSANPDEAAPGQDGIPPGPQPLRAIVEAAAEPYQRAGVRFVIEAGPDSGAESAPEPRLKRSAELLHGLGNLLENALEFAASQVRVAIRWNAKHISVAILDDGPGFDPTQMAQLGEPYRSGGAQGREGKSVHMGLGVFIAQTLLERTGATVAFGNAEAGGAEVSIVWPRAALEQRQAAQQRRTG
jgi:two-component system sensor histidine kinase RegB